MLYLNIPPMDSLGGAGNLTLTSVVFEFFWKIYINIIVIDLTLTSVVFELATL